VSLAFVVLESWQRGEAVRRRDKNGPGCWRPIGGAALAEGQQRFTAESRKPGNDDTMNLKTALAINRKERKERIERNW